MLGTYDANKPDITMPCHPLMARPLSSKHRYKVVEEIKKWPHPRYFSGQIATSRNYLQVYTLNQFQSEFLDWTIKTGTVRQFEVDHATFGRFNLIINPYLLRPEHVKAAYELQHASPDQNDTENAKLTTEFTSSAFKGTIITQLRLKLSHGTPGCILFSYAMWHLQHVSFELIDKKKAALKSLKLSSYPQEDVSLHMFDRVDPDLLVVIARSFETGSDPRFRLFAFGQTSLWKKEAEGLRYKTFNKVMSYKEFQLGSKSSFDIREHRRQSKQQRSALPTRQL